jgi:hypothetical protein
MEPSQEAFNWFVRRWQVRLFIAGFALPVPMWVLYVFLLGGREESAAIAFGLIGGAFLLTCLLLQCWRIERPKRSRKQSPVAVHQTGGKAV